MEMANVPETVEQEEGILEPAHFEPEDILDSKELCNPEVFMQELQELCVKHNMTIFAGALGIRFVPRDSQGLNIDNDIAGKYWSQAFTTKEFMQVE